ncbi:MAG TPA: redoxin domain-containing protein [Sphingobacteriaceae bacterium]
MKSVRHMLTALFVALTFHASAQQPRQLPPFRFFRLDSAPFTGQDLQKGRTSVFILFDSGCDHCQKEIPAIGKQFGQLGGCSFYFVSFDEPAQITAFMKTYGKDFYGKKNVVMLRDRNREFLPTFFPEKFPAVFMYAPAGQLIYYRSGNQDVRSMIRAAGSVRK